MLNDTSAAIRALRIRPEDVGMGFVARHLKSQIAVARRTPPIPAWALPGAHKPFEQIIIGNPENTK